MGEALRDVNYAGSPTLWGAGGGSPRALGPSARVPRSVQTPISISVHRISLPHAELRGAKRSWALFHYDEGDLLRVDRWDGVIHRCRRIFPSQPAGVQFKMCLFAFFLCIYFSVETLAIPFSATVASRNPVSFVYRLSERTKKNI